MTKLYSDLATWWPLFSPLEDYKEEADFFQQVIVDNCPTQPATLLELGSGGGSVAYYLKRHFTSVTLTDISPDMLAISRTINPNCEHVQGDMRTVRLGREFDVVFIHDAIMYMTTRDDLRQAIETAFIHCAQGGLAMFVPDEVRETFESGSESGGTDGDGRGIRYLEWSVDPDPTDTIFTVDYVLVFREGNQPVQVEHDTHLNGLFAQAEWIQLLTETGFAAEYVIDPFKRLVFLARKPTVPAS